MRNYRTFSSLKLGVIITATFFIFGATVTNAAPIKVLSNGNHGYSRIVDTINQLLGVGHVGTDIIVHRNTLSTLGSISPNEAFSSDTRYDESGVAVSSQAPYHLFTTSSTGYGGDSITTYNLTDTYDYAFNFPITVSTNSPPPAFHIAPGGGGWASFSGVEWTTDPNVFPASSLSGLAADNAGILAVLRYQHPTWNWFDVKAALRQSGTNWDTGYDDTDYGFGIVSYATTTAYADNEILLQPPVASAVLSGYVNQITFTLYPFKQTRRVKEVLFQFASDPGFQANELTLSDITALGGTKITEYTATTATSTLNPVFVAVSNGYFAWLTADNTDDNSANFSRIDTYSVLGPLTQNEIHFTDSFELSSPADNTPASTQSPTFIWEDAESYLGISKYQLFIDGTLDTDNISGTTATPSSALSPGTHTWYVKAFNGNGTATSSASTYTTNVVSGYTSSHTWYVDNVLGDDNNPGTQAQPWSTLAKASATAQPGNTVVVVKNNGVPYRESVAPLSGNTTDGNITFRGVDADSKPEIWGSDDMSGGWSVYSGGNADTYQKSVASTVSVVAAGPSISNLTKKSVQQIAIRTTGLWWSRLLQIILVIHQKKCTIFY